MPGNKETKFRADVGKRLRTTREVLGLDQGELGDILDVVPNAVSQYEKGKRYFAPELAVKLKRAKGVTLDWIYAEDPTGLPHNLYEKLTGPRPVKTLTAPGRKRSAA